MISENPLTDREKHELTAGFYEFAVGKTGSHGNIAPFTYSIREEDKLIGAITGQTFWGSLQITNHWVESSHRHCGHGKELLEKAEDFSREMGCDFITVHTFDVEARDFYLSHGFELELERPGYQGGLLHLFLLKKEIL